MVAGSVALSIVAPSVVRAQRKYDPGVTDQEIRIGHTNPYSGPASSFGIIGKGHAAYWNGERYGRHQRSKGEVHFLR